MVEKVHNPGGGGLPPVGGMNAFDEQLVEMVSGMARTVGVAQAMLDEQGVIEAGGESNVPHPGVDVVRKLSQELRGWCTARPDLFGEQKPVPVQRRKPSFKAV